MMKRQGVTRLGGPDESSPLPQHPQSTMSQQGAANMHTLAQSAQPQLLGSGPVGTGGGYPRARPPTPVINYMKAAPAQLQYAPKPAPPRHKPLGSQSPGAAVGPVVAGGVQFQRLKVEDALSYLDQVKYKFNAQPQVYNDFLDIMKEFKSQTIDTPGVITRVSNLFQGHPELIVGFNTFLPPGYKIEVQSNGQVSVSMPSPTSLAAAGAVGVGGVGAVGVGAVGVGAVGVGAVGAALLQQHPAPQLVHLLPVHQPLQHAASLQHPQAQAAPVAGAIVHNLSVGNVGAVGSVGGVGNVGASGAHSTLHHISQAHQQLEAQHHAHGGGQNSGHPQNAPSGQPVEFNHAIEYVNKIKSRFSRQPDKYKRFLEILHAYQRGHRDLKEPLCKQQTEQEVYSQVAKLFENQEDLLTEFGQFLPDAKTVPTKHAVHQQRSSVEGDSEGGRYPPASVSPAPLHAQISKHSSSMSTASSTPQHHHLKRSPSFGASSQIAGGGGGGGGPPAKKARLVAFARDVSYAEAAKYGTLQEFNFFDRVRHALRSQDVYDNFLRCLLLYTNEIVSSSELIQLTQGFFSRHPELQRWLHDFVGPVSPPTTPTNVTHTSASYTSLGVVGAGAGAGAGAAAAAAAAAAVGGARLEAVGALGAQLRHDRPQGDAALELDLSTCKRLGTSYCALPRGSAEAAARKCSGRTALCKEVLNDTWVSFPTWSEDSTFVTSRKTQYEEYIYRCEDERFELDVVLETNAATIRVLEGVQKRLARLSADDAAKLRLDDCLGGCSPTIHQRALRRIYGDKAVDIIAGLKKNPAVAVPVVLRRLKAKEEEWREAQKGFNKQWREQNEKYYLKSLDHAGINFKQNDMKALRSKCLFNEIESAYLARAPPPHLLLPYDADGRREAVRVVKDAAELLIYHARRQSAIQKSEKKRIKLLLRHFLPDLLAHPRLQLSDDEKDDEDKHDQTSPGSLSPGDNDDCSKDMKPEKSRGEVFPIPQPSSESDNASDQSTRNKNNKENTPKNNNTTENNIKDANNLLKWSGSNEDATIKTEYKPDPDADDDFKEARPSNRMVCTMSWYLFLRLHAVLCQRLTGARRAARELAEGAPLAEPDEPPPPPPAPAAPLAPLAPLAAAPAAAPAPPRPAALALRLRPSNLPPDASSPQFYYKALLELVRTVLDGNTEPSAFEDTAREMFGIKAYPVYTLDKIVAYAVRQLQHCVSESWSWHALEMCWRELRGAGAASPGGAGGGPGGGGGGGALYLRKARHFLSQDHTTFLVKAYTHQECKISITLLEGANAGRTNSLHNNDNSRLSPTHQPRASNGETVSRVAAWSLYSERYSRPAGAAGAAGAAAGAGGAGGAQHRAVFLRRNARRCGGGGGQCSVPGAGAGAGAQGAGGHARRKPVRVYQDNTECTLHPTLRAVSGRGLRGVWAYRAGALAAARRSQPRLHAARRLRLRGWLRRRLASPHYE